MLMSPGWSPIWLSQKRSICHYVLLLDSTVINGMEFQKMDLWKGCWFKKVIVWPSCHFYVRHRKWLEIKTTRNIDRVTERTLCEPAIQIQSRGNEKRLLCSNYQHSHCKRQWLSCKKWLSTKASVLSTMWCSPLCYCSWRWSDYGRPGGKQNTSAEYLLGERQITCTIHFCDLLLRLTCAAY